ncbi:hypothetical protein [Vreelandella sulfidaeris]|uniref:hypothetical protein n=1 Tax=Vreelandella sulfidaeris TaxID=115553 RepID=UPI0011BE3FEB|nr:hypothetical protein [Halomonas sulfidaeris]
MNKLLSDKETIVREKVLTWINKSGFPLEMEAAKAFRNAGFEVRQSATHLDPQEQKGREIDVLAQDPDWIGVIDIYFVVECKSSDKPWVVLMADDVLSNFNRVHAFAVTSIDAKPEIFSVWHNNEDFKFLLGKSTRCGYSFRQALGGKNDQAYTASISVLKACAGLTRERTASALKRFAFALPVIVVDTPIFECTLNSNGDIELAEVDQSDFLFSAHMPDEVACCIKVIRKDKLQEFTQTAKKTADSLRQFMEESEQAAIESAGSPNH